MIALAVATVFLGSTSAQATHLLAPGAAVPPHHRRSGGADGGFGRDDRRGEARGGLHAQFRQEADELRRHHRAEGREDGRGQLYTTNLTAAYGLTKYLELGLDVPFNYAANSLHVPTDRYINNFNIGDIRVNAKYRLIDAPKYGLALVAFANLPTGNDEFLLTEKKVGLGARAVGHYDVSKAATLYANLGAEQVGDISAARTDPNYYTPWYQYGVGGVYRLPGNRKDQLVAEINGETPMAYPYGRTVTSPVEVLGAYRREISPGLSLTAGGGGGLNKGMGAPQWRAFLGISGVFDMAKAPPPASTAQTGGRSSSASAAPAAPAAAAGTQAGTGRDTAAASAAGTQAGGQAGQGGHPPSGAV